MIRSLIVAAFGLGLTACQPVSGGGGGEDVARVGGDTVPATYDWSFVAHGGSADLDFGDGDWAEGVSLFHMSCLPDSQVVRASWDGGSEAVLTSGTATGTFRREVDAAADHPVFAALREGNALAVGMDDADLTLAAKAPGRAQIKAFFDYCTHPLPPPPEPVVAAATEPVPPPLEGDDQPDDLSGVKPVEPGVDVVQPDRAAHEPVDR
ncbi:hypothetical protein MMB232_03104 [Brevundimonas subvibrioides]|uniref:hypothetical protein n=1 Tax=Brevundimonas subvibrioides TaxID=74313 RepID=UPI0032D5AF11